MCRIAGMVSNKLSQNQLLENVENMCNAMQSGGPDGEGFKYFSTLNTALGHRRLSIIDLSENGSQPMVYANHLWITFNGEIYNYLELKADLIEKRCQFQNQTDTEVILAGYSVYGNSFFEKLKGMFAFALLDTTTNKTYLVRDYAGIKPLYYSVENDELYFASQVKAFNATHKKWKAREDWKIYFLTFGFIPEPFTTLQDVYSLPKGHYLCWDHQTSKSTIVKYADDTVTKKQVEPKTAQSNTRQKLNAAVKRHLIADAPIGVFLSGGVDSSLLTLIADEQHNGKVNTVSLNFNETEFSEKQYQEIVVNRINSEHVSHTVTAEEFENHVHDIFAAMDQPSNDAVNSWFVSKVAKQAGLKAVLSGIGADEFFGGYPSFKRYRLIRALKILPKFALRLCKHLPNEKLRRISFLAYRNPVGEYLFLRGFYTSNIISKLINVAEDQIEALIEKYKLDEALNKLSNQERISWFETNIYMQNQLLKDTDFMSMAHGVEVRVPFLDKDVINETNSLPNSIRFSKQPKGLLIESYLDVLPKAIWDRQKKGFTFPFQHWFKTYKPILSEEHYQNNQQAIKLLNKFKTGALPWSKLFAIYQIFLHVD